jgi:hypothetical protein
MPRWEGTHPTSYYKWPKDLIERLGRPPPKMARALSRNPQPAKPRARRHPQKSAWSFLVPLPILIFDDFGLRKLPLTSAEELPDVVMRRHERVRTALTANRLVEDCGNLAQSYWATAAAMSAVFDRLLHHEHGINAATRAGALKTDLPPQEAAG